MPVGEIELYTNDLEQILTEDGVDYLILEQGIESITEVLVLNSYIQQSVDLPTNIVD